MTTLKDKTLFITGASRGIGKAIALRAAADGANIVIVAKTANPHPKLPGTIHTAADEIEAAGGRALAVQTDIRFEDQVESAVQKTVETFGGIDILVNNASAIFLKGTGDLPMKRFDLMWSVNARGTFVSCQACLPHLREATNPHILMISPPLNMEAKWFQNHCAYTMSKYGMSMCALGMAEEFRPDGIAVNALWPKTVIDTAAIRMLGGIVQPDQCRSPKIVADAAYEIFVQNSQTCTGNFFTDEQVLASAGVSNFAPYDVRPGTPLAPDFFLD